MDKFLPHMVEDAYDLLINRLASLVKHEPELQNNFETLQCLKYQYDSYMFKQKEVDNTNEAR